MMFKQLITSTDQGSEENLLFEVSPDINQLNRKISQRVNQSVMHLKNEKQTINLIKSSRSISPMTSSKGGRFTNNNGHLKKPVKSK
jgi:hypothetical protein